MSERKKSTDWLVHWFPHLHVGGGADGAARAATVDDDDEDEDDEDEDDEGEWDEWDEEEIVLGGLVLPDIVETFRVYGPLLDVSTRWWSTDIMLLRFYILIPVFNKVLSRPLFALHMETKSASHNTHQQ